MKWEFFNPSSFLQPFRAKTSRITSLLIDHSTVINKSLGWMLSLAALIGLGLYSISEGQDISFDLQNYHLYNPYAYLNDRILIDLFPAGLQSYFNPFLDLAYFAAISIWSPLTVGFLLGAVHGLNFLLLLRISRGVLKEHRFGEFYSLSLAVAGVLSVGFLSEVGTVFHDDSVTLILMLSLWMIMDLIDSPAREQPDIRHNAKILCAGLLAGIASGLKLTFSMYALALCVSFLVADTRWKIRLQSGIFFGVSVLAGLLISNGYWMFKMWSLFGNPIFPLYNHIFQGELIRAVPFFDARFLPKTLLEKLFYPVFFTLDPSRVAEFRYEQISWLCCYAAVLILLVHMLFKTLKRSSSPNRLNCRARFLLAFFCVSYLLWIEMFGIYRYLIPLEILIPLILFVVSSYFFKRRHAWGGLLLVVAITGVNLRGMIPDWGHAEWSDRIYKVEPGELSESPEPAVVYLAGQPLGWIVPALDIDAPFIQVAPRWFPVTDAYWQRAKALAEGRKGRRFVIWAPETSTYAAAAKAGLEKLGLRTDCTEDRFLIGYLGKARFEYKYCEVEPQDTALPGSGSVSKGRALSETTEKRAIHEDTRRTTKTHEERR